MDPVGRACVVDVAKERGRLRLDPAYGPLDRWAAQASQVDKNAVYSALFAVADGSVRKAYETLDSSRPPSEFVIVVRSDLVVKIYLTGAELFGIAYIGPVELLSEQGGERAA
jgi:Family of unknown function (DUF6235)